MSVLGIGQYVASISDFCAFLLRRRLIVVLLMAISALFAVLRLDTTQVGFFGDDAHYAVLAESLATGRGYRLINYPHAPVEYAFPPGWPLLLAPLAGLFPGSYLPMKLLAVFFWLASIPLIYAVFAPRLRPPYLEGLVGLAALSPHLVGASAMVMSESAYLFFSLLALGLFAYWQRTGRRAWPLVLALSAALYTAAIRTIGLTLVLAILLYVLASSGRRSLLYAGGTLLLGGAILVGVAAHQGGALVFSSSYYRHFLYVASHLGDYARFWEHLSLFSDPALVALLIPGWNSGPAGAWLPPQVRLLVGVGVLLALLLGFALSLRHFQLMDLYCALYGGIFYLWTVYIGRVQVRHLIPLLVFFYFYILVALGFAAGRIVPGSPRRAQQIVLGMIAPIMLLALFANYQDWHQPLSARTTDLASGTTWIRHNAPAGAIVVSPEAVADFLYTRRQTVDYPSSSRDVMEYIEAHNADYVIVKPNTSSPRSTQLNDTALFHLLPAIEANPDSFDLVYRDDVENISVYRVLR